MAFQIAQLLDKMTSADKDYRFMATNDLMTDLQNDSIKLDDESERKVARMLIKLLEDRNGEVQNLAVRCLGPFFRKIREVQAEVIVDHLCDKMMGKDEKLRDVASIALKTVINELPASNGTVTTDVVKRVVPRLTIALKHTEPTDFSVRLEILDIITDLLTHYGGILFPYMKPLQEVLVQKLFSDRQSLRKKAIIALSCLAVVADNGLYDATVKTALENFTAANARSADIRTMALTLQQICKTTGRRFVKHLPVAVVLLERFARESDDDELREACIQAFETFMYRCPREITPYIQKIGDVALTFVKHDPNYTYDEEDEDMDKLSQMDVDGETEDEEDDGADYSDDEDLSWKVRRASAKCIEAMIVSRRSELVEYVRTIGPLLISRFKEREENVKWDVMHAYAALLTQVHNLLPNFAAAQISSPNDGTVGKEGGDTEIVELRGGLFRRSAFGEEELAVLKGLDEQMPALARACSKQLASKNMKTKQQCFVLLSNLLRAYPGCLTNELEPLMRGVATAMNDRSLNSNIKYDIFTFLGCALVAHPPEKLHPHMDVVVPLVVQAIREQFYKLAAEGLSVTSLLIRVLRPSVTESCGFDYTPYVGDIYEAVVEKMRASDIDQEVKEKAINATGLLIATFADVLQDKLRVCLPLMLERLKNETTRYMTVKSLTVVVSSPLGVSLDIILTDILFQLADFLRKNSRPLKISTLQLLDTLMKSYKHGIDPDGLLRVVNETPALINESDLQTSQLAFTFLSHLMYSYADLISAVWNELSAALVTILQSSLLQGATLSAALKFTKAFVRAPIPDKPDFETLLNQLTSPVYDHDALPRAAYRSISACAATVAYAHGKMEDCRVLATTLSELLTSAETKEGVRLFALFTIGELGCKCPDTFNNFTPPPEDLLLSAFTSLSEEAKAAASYSLGRLSIGNLEKYLPFLLNQINAQPKKQYLMLHALKEVIGTESSEPRAFEIFRPRIDQIWPVLMKNATAGEEGTRNVVAECIGKLCRVHPEFLLPKLKECVQSSNANMRATAVTAVKYLIVEQWTPIDDLLQSSLRDFLKAVTDTDLNVRRVAFVTLNSAAHNKPKLIRDLLPQLLPSLYSETIVKKELIREVEMGPFKHIVDDGLDLRKSAFECMYTLLEKCPDRLDLFDFIVNMENGLKDQHDIKLLTYLMAVRLASVCPTQVLQRIDTLCEPLKTQILSKPKAHAVKQESDKHDELRRAALRVVHALQAVPDVERQQAFADLLLVIKSSAEIFELYQVICRDTGHRVYSIDGVMEME